MWCVGHFEERYNNEGNLVPARALQACTGILVPTLMTAVFSAVHVTAAAFYIWILLHLREILPNGEAPKEMNYSASF